MSEGLKVQQHPSGCGCEVVSQPGQVQIKGHNGSYMVIDARGDHSPWLPGALAAAIEHARTGDFDA